LDVATAIVAPLAAGLAAGLADGVAVPDDDELLPHAAASNANAAEAVVNNVLDRTYPVYRAGLRRGAYSGVTYAAVIPPSTTNVEPLT
jgi:hypothetical protein